MDFMAITLQTSPARNESNKLLAEDRPAHDWYRFVLSFPPHLVRHYLDRFKVRKEQCVLDPFCGTGTTLVECKKRGIPSIGIEANPMAFFASQVKVDWRPNPTGLVSTAQQVADKTLEKLREGDIEDEVILSQDSPMPAENWRTIPPDLHKLLLTNSISPLPLHKALVLLDCIDACKSRKSHSHLRLAFAKAIVFSISNLHFGPEVGVAPPKSDTPVLSPWLTEVRKMADDLRELAGAAIVSSQVLHADSRKAHAILEPASIDAVITSPPYPNEKDYTRTTRLESVLLGLISCKNGLQELKRTLVRSNTRSVYKTDADDKWVADHKEIQRIARAIETRRLQLGKTSGFERMYPRVTKLYFGGMARHLAALRTVLRPGAQLAYVVGDQASYLRVMIRTGQLLADIGKSLGYEVTDIDLFRTRLATATREQLREEVVVLRWPGGKRLKTGQTIS
jgi:DNA modification methylase